MSDGVSSPPNEQVLVEGWPARWVEAVTRAREAEADIERLRSALESIALSSCEAMTVLTAREALGSSETET